MFQPQAVALSIIQFRGTPPPPQALSEVNRCIDMSQRSQLVSSADSERPRCFYLFGPSFYGWFVSIAIGGRMEDLDVLVRLDRHRKNDSTIDGSLNQVSPDRWVKSVARWVVNCASLQQEVGIRRVNSSDDLTLIRNGSFH